MLVSIFDPSWVSPGAPQDDAALRSYRQVLSDAQSSRSGDIKVGDDPAASDVVIVPASTTAFGPCFEALKANRVFRACRRKTVIYCAQDMFHFPLPGLYAACSRFGEATGWALPAHYRSDHLPKWAITQAETAGERDLLFSFVGDFQNHLIRRKIGTLRHARCAIHDASPGGQRWWDRSSEEQMPFKERFREFLLRSKFVLCPRGVVASSIRLFEAMEAGAVPVLIADGVTLPKGPQWDEFCVRVRERDFASIPSVLEALEPRARELGAAARRAWEAFFSPEFSFQSLVSWGDEVRANVGTARHSLLRMWATFDASVRPQVLVRRWRFLRRNHLERN